MATCPTLAVHDYKPGDAIQTCEPLLKFVEREKIGQVCTNCLKESYHLKKCAQCGLAYYCDKKCQGEDWNFAHKSECKSGCYRGCCPNGPNAGVKLIVFRMVAAFCQNPSLMDKQHKMVDGSERTFKDLASHTEKETSLALALELTRMHLEMKEDSVRASVDHMMELFSVYKTNSHRVYNDGQTKVLGSGIYIEQSIFNHSCKPNAFFCTYGGTEMTIRATAQISQGEEIYISYIAEHGGKQDRQALLKERYHFECHCITCETEADSKVNYVKLSKLIEEMELNKYFQRMSFSEAINKHNTILGMLRQIYNEYDDRIANQFIRLLNVIAWSQDLLKLPEDKYKELMQEIGRHILTTFGPRHYDYREYVKIVQAQRDHRQEELKRQRRPNRGVK